ncbi:MAG: rRNA pseudouridine synthase [Bacilli bacterium]|jgi:16S rRNA pseudouridine516 synthase|nr:rRNA pseudouridine synthase [Bacilli bacterium]
MRLDKFLSQNGYGTRKEVKKIIKNGNVTINGTITKNNDYHLQSDDVVKCNNIIIEQLPNVYLMMNKPAGYVCANEDNLNKTIFLLIDEYYQTNLFTVGRLDKDTTGLLLITNDGQWNHNIIKPKKNITKTYQALITNKITAQDIELFKEGVIIENGYRTKPAHIKVIKEYEDKSLVEIVITEGKFHQVKKMVHAIKQEVLELKRIKIGNLELDQSLELGAYRFLTSDEINKFF